MVNKEKTFLEVQNLSKSFRKLPPKDITGSLDWIHNLIQITKRRITGKSLDYSVIKAVNDVNLAIREKEIVGLVGPNGAGKTTLLKMIASLYLPDSGTILIDGKEICQHTDVCLVGSGRWAIFDVELSNLENIKYLLSLWDTKIKDTKIKDYFTKFNLADHYDTYPNVLSAGQRQKLLLITGLLLDAKIYLFDEISAGLDPISKNELHKLIKQEIIEKKGATVLYTTHDLTEVQELCERFLIMNKGKILFDKTLEELREMVEIELDSITITGINLTEQVCSIIKQIPSVKETILIDEEKNINKIRIYGEGITVNDILTRTVDADTLDYRLMSVKKTQLDLKDIIHLIDAGVLSNGSD